MSYYASITVDDRNVLKRLVQRARLAQSLHALHDAGPDFSGAILDLGTGDGLLCRQLAQRFPRAEIYGYEPVPSLLQYAQLCAAELSNVRFTGDLNDFLGRRFDYIFCLEVLEHLPRRETRRLFEQVRAFADGRTTVVFGVPNELYLAAMCKGLFRFARRRRRSFDARLAGVFAAAVGRPPRRRPLAEIWPGHRYYFHHLGFDYRALARLLERQFSVVSSFGSPWPGGPLLLNSEVYFVCRLLPSETARTRRAA
ncbi:MAG: class I SAM-dependent methyltransferase [Pirellulales bacterium]|nr:class I SAM-dependent methyltransferase [Pirellulales bacterium]